MGSRGEALMNDLPKGRPLAIDATARSASPTEPAFIAPPEGAPVYHGFCRTRRRKCGWFHAWQDHRLGSGALRNRRCVRDCAGRKPRRLVLEACDPPYFQETMPIEADRWGVWGVGFALPMDSHENARKNLDSILPELKLRWAEWKARFSGSPKG